MYGNFLAMAFLPGSYIRTGQQIVFTINSAWMYLQKTELEDMIQRRRGELEAP